MLSGRDIDLITYALEFLRGSLSRDILRDIRAFAKRGGAGELAQGELQAVRERVGLLPFTNGKPLSEKLQRFMTFHIHCRTTLIAQKSKTTAREVFAYYLEQGPDVIADRFIDWGRNEKYAGQYDTPYFEEMAAEIEDKREEAKAFITMTVQNMLDVLPINPKLQEETSGESQIKQAEKA
jgi:hypothetical protein